MKRSYYTKE